MIHKTILSCLLSGIALMSILVCQAAPQESFTLTSLGDLNTPLPNSIASTDQKTSLRVTLSPNLRITNQSAESSFPDIAVDASGISYMTWQDYRDGNFEIYYCQTNSAGQKLTPEIRITSTGGSSTLPKIALDAAKNAHIVWKEGNSIYYAKLDATSNTLVAPLLITGDFSDSPDVAAQPDGTAGICWEKQYGVAYTVGFRRLNPEGQFVGNEATIYTEYFYADRRPRIDSDSEGNFYVVFKEIYGIFLDTRIYLGKITPDNSIEYLYAVGGTNSAQHPAVAMVGNNTGYIYQEDRIGGNWEVVKYSGQQFSEAAGNSFSLDICAHDNNDGLCYLSWEDDRDGTRELYYGQLENNAKVGGDLRVSDLAFDSQNSAVATGQDGHAYFVWQDSRDGNWEIYFATTAPPPISRPDLTPIRIGGQWRADISFSSSPRGDDWVTITATVRNDGDSSAINVQVQFFDGDPTSGGTLINSTESNNPDIIAQIPANSSGTISVDWQPGATGGKNGIFMVVDPQNLIAEADEGNNTGKYYKPPVIMISGIAGAPLKNAVSNPQTKEWFVLGHPLFYLYLKQDGETDEFSNVFIESGPVNGVTIGDELSSLPLSLVFKDLVDDLQSNSAFNLDNDDGVIEPHENLFFFLYDWRKSSSNPSNSLAQFIEQVRQTADIDKIDIVAHSMGGLLVKSYIKRILGSRDKIRQLIFAGTPHLGAPKSFYVLKTGQFIPIPHTGETLYYYPGQMRRVAQYSPGTYQLIPHQNYFVEFSGYPPQFQVYKSYITPLKKSPLDYQESRQFIIDDPDYPENILTTAESFTNELTAIMDFQPIQVRNIVGYDLPTIGQIQEFDYDGATLWIAIRNVQGDGTVPLHSAERYNNPASFDKADYYLRNVAHSALLSSEPGRLIVSRLLGWITDASIPPHNQITAPEQIHNNPVVRYVRDYLSIQWLATNSSVPANSLRIKGNTNTAAKNQTSIPDTLITEIVNSQNQVVSVTKNYVIHTEISGSNVEIYGVPNDTIIASIFLPRNDVYQIRYKTPDSVASLQLTLEETKNGILENRLSYATLSVVKNSGLQFVLQPSLDAVLITVDLNGDGQFESTISSSLHQSSRVVSFTPINWHLFSPPVDMSYASVADFFNGVTINGQAYIWNSGAYVLADTFQVGKGSWLPISNEKVFNFAGISIDSLQRYFFPGWHLIGGLSKVSDFSDPHDSPDGSIIATFGWDPIAQSYYPAMALEPGKGYWIAVAQECDLTIGGSSTTSVAKATKAMSWQEFAATFGTMPPPPPNTKPEATPKNELPSEFRLFQNYPNPFNPETKIEYSVPQRVFVQLEIYNLLGQKVRTLIAKEMPGGYYVADWDGKGDRGEFLPAGVYLVRLQAGEFVAVQKTTLLR